MLLFSWKKIYQHSEGLPTEILRIFRMLTYNQIPRNQYDKLYKYATKSFMGECFMLHPDVLMYNAYKHDSTDLAMYVALCALRSYPEYVAYGTLTLPLAHSPVDPRERFKDDSLLYIDDDDLIHFIYEEAETNQTKH